MARRTEQALQTPRILWFALLSTNAMYVGMLKMAHEESGVPPHLPELLGALALGIAVFSVVFPARMFAQSLRALDVKTADQVGEVVGSFRESAPVQRVIVDPDAAMRGALARFQQPFILGMALAESISLFGFMLGFMGERPQVYAPFFAVGVALMFSKFPRASTIERAVERATNAKLRF